jgi:hypothetical protein
MRRVFFHIHIWKTAGATFLNVCRKNFGKAFHRDVMLIQQWSLSAQQLKWLLDYHKWLRCYSCHMLSGNLPYDVEGTEIFGISFVRNPIDRFISSYHYMMDDNYRGGYSKVTSFDEIYARTFVDVNNPWWRNGQTHIIAGHTSESKALSLIRKRLSQGRLILLVTERFDESCIVLERLFPVDFKDCSYVRYNVSPKKKIVTESQRKAVSQYVNLDSELLEIANDYLDAILDRLFPNLNKRQQYLSDFKKRCRVKERKNNIINAIKSFEYAAKRAILKSINSRNK